MFRTLAIPTGGGDRMDCTLRQLRCENATRPSPPAEEELGDVSTPPIELNMLYYGTTYVRENPCKTRKLGDTTGCFDEIARRWQLSFPSPFLLIYRVACGGGSGWPHHVCTTHRAASPLPKINKTSAARHQREGGACKSTRDKFIRSQAQTSL